MHGNGVLRTIEDYVFDDFMSTEPFRVNCTLQISHLATSGHDRNAYVVVCFISKALQQFRNVLQASYRDDTNKHP
jgi:hypothetical protein